jgi:tripartite-type tricarboxylate transporter receptor subunit TctC
MTALSRRDFTRLLAALPAAGAAWSAQANTPGKLIVGYPAGGTLDTTARHLVDALRREGRAYIVDNRPGAAGRIANSQLKREAGDGLTLLCTHTSALTIFPHVYTRLMYDAQADFVPVSPIVTADCAFAISSAVPATVKGLPDYVAWVRQNPNAALYASPAAGSVAHFLGWQLGEAGGVKLEHVAYRGSAPAMQDLLGGQVPAYFGFVADFLPHLQQGKLRILGVTSEQRSRFLPSVPTFGQQGFAQIRGAETYGLFAPPGTPAETVNALQAAIDNAGRDPALRAAYDKVGLEVRTRTARDFAAQIRQERDAWAPVVRASGYRLEE